MPADFDLSGTLLPLKVRAGAAAVLRLRDWTDGIGALINFTGSTFDGAVSRRNDTTSASMPLVFEVIGLGAVDVLLPNTSGWDAGSFFVAKPTYNYVIWFTDSLGVRLPQLYGPISVFAELPE